MISTLLTTLLVIDSLVLIFLVVALQQGNEGGMSSSLGSGNSQGFFGASGGVQGIIRATWICGVLFFVLAMSAAWTKTREHYAVKSNLEKQLLAPRALKTNSPLNSVPVSPIRPTPAPTPVPHPTNPNGEHK